MTTRRHFMRDVMLAALATAGCGRPDGTLRFSGIPDGDKRALKTGFETVAAYLSERMALRVEYVHVPDYTAAVTALATGALEFAWLGGVTTVQAEQRTPGGVHHVCARRSDLAFRSYVVANRAVAESKGLSTLTERSPQPLTKLAALKGALSGSKFSFGAKSSTSGHVMPRAFLTSAEVGIDPRGDFDGGPVYQLKGGHSATLRAVASGAVDFGVLNFVVWEKASKQLQQDAPVIYVTPNYVDYCLVARGDWPQTQVDKLRAAFVGLDASAPKDAEVLKAFSAEAFVDVKPEQWGEIRRVLARLEETGELQ